MKLKFLWNWERNCFLAILFADPQAQFRTSRQLEIYKKYSSGCCNIPNGSNSKRLKLFNLRRNSQFRHLGCKTVEKIVKRWTLILENTKIDISLPFCFKIIDDDFPIAWFHFSWLAHFLCWFQLATELQPSCLIIISSLWFSSSTLHVALRKKIWKDLPKGEAKKVLHCKISVWKKLKMVRISKRHHNLV